jgi:hypothetical protein
MRKSGRLDNPSPVKPEVQDEGQPKSYIAGVAGGGERHWGNPEPGRNQQRRRYAKFGATRADHRRHSRRTEDKGQPEDSDAGSAERERGTGQPGNATRAGWEDAGSGATRNLIGRQNGTMHDPMSYTIIRKAPEAARSLAFSILGISRNQSVADFRISRSSFAVRTVARRGKSFSVRHACTSES